MQMQRFTNKPDLRVEDSIEQKNLLSAFIGNEKWKFMRVQQQSSSFLRAS